MTIKSNQICQNFLATHGNYVADMNERIQSLDVTQSYMVKAPAGSGKTELLTQRYLALLSIVNKPEEILAITFTNKAGAEMQARILSALQSATRAKPELPHEQLTWELGRNALNRSEEKGWELLLNPNRLNVRTIDSFFTGIAKKSPLGSGAGGNLNVSSQFETLYVEAAQSLLDDLEHDTPYSDALISVLKHLDNRFYRAEELFVSLLKKRDSWLPMVVQGAYTTDLRSVLESSLSDVVDNFLENSYSTLSIYQTRISELLSFAVNHIDFDKNEDMDGLKFYLNDAGLPDNSIDGMMAWRALPTFLLTKGGDLRKSGTAAIGFPAPSATKDKDQKELYKNMKDLYGELLSELAEDEDAFEVIKMLQHVPFPHYTDEQWQSLQDIITLLPFLAAKLNVVFERHGKVDFTQISSAALHALGSESDPSELALSIDGRLSHILIDEFQDTSINQLESLKMLTAGWQPDDGRTLFLVGDAQQSIYAFRGSNVGLFLNVQQYGLPNVDIEVLSLSVNFRSQQGIVDWVNNVFDDLLPKQIDINMGAVTYDASIANKKLITGVEPVIATAFIHDKDDSHIAANAEGAWITQKIRELRQTDPEASIAILVRGRSHLTSIVEHLRLSEEEFQAVDIDPLKDLMPIRDLTALLRSICDPCDRTAWLSVLRSPLVGLTLGELELIALAQARTTIWENINSVTVLDGLSDETRVRLRRFTKAMKGALYNEERKPLSMMLEGVWLALNGAATLKTASELEAVKTFLEVVKGFSYATFDIHNLESTLDDLYAKPVITGKNPVQIMTMHKSKGLQFDYVFLAGCHRWGMSNDRELIAWDRYTTDLGQELPLMAASAEIGVKDRAIYNFLNQQARIKGINENHRILYVACTRAIKQLFMTGFTTRNNDDSMKKPNPTSFFGSIWKTIEEQVKEVDAADYAESANTQGVQMIVEKQALVKAPVLPEGNVLTEYRGLQEVNNNKLPKTDWELSYSRQLGNVLHRILRQVAIQGADAWTNERINERRISWGNMLTQDGVQVNYLNPILDKLTAQLGAMLKDEAALWVLSNQHKQSQCELPVMTLLNGKPKKFVIDRTFIDKTTGTRWIVDYKSDARRNGETDEAYRSRIAKAHTKQLKDYAEIMRSMGNEQIKIAVYSTSENMLVEII